MQDEPMQSHAPPPDRPRPCVLTDAEFDDYCNGLAQGYSEAEVMSVLGIRRREYWRVQCAANRRRNREAWAQTKRFRESNRRHDKWESLYSRAMKDGDTLGSLRAVRRWSAYHYFDQNRRLAESPQD